MKSTGEDVRRNPVPSLLRSLMTEHLDPGYEATAFERQHEHTKNRPSKTGPWLALGALLIGFIVTVSAVQATKQVTGTEEVRSELVAKVRDAEDRIDSLAASRDSLGGAVDAARGVALEGDARGSAVLDQLRAVESGAGAEAVHGEGLVVTLTDPAGRPNLSDASQRSVGGKTVVLDRDLQTVVNALWAGRRRGDRRRRRANRADGNHPSSRWCDARRQPTCLLPVPRRGDRRHASTAAESSSSATPT